MPETEVLTIDADAPDERAIQYAAQCLRDGKLVAFPTETVYGLGANALDAAAVARIFAAKGRPSNNPLIVHVPDTEAAMRLVTEWPEKAAKLAERFWPGPLTLVLPRRELIPDLVTGGGPTVGLRVPAHPTAVALLRAAGVPVAAPSANRSLQISPTRAEHVLHGLDGRIELLLDSGPTPGGLESTVLNLTTQPPTLLRPGLILPAEIEAIIGPIARSAPAASDSPLAPLPAPGMLTRHYAPRASLEMVGKDAWERIENLLRQGKKVGWMARADRHPSDRMVEGLIRLEMPENPVAYAALLYAALHTLDAARVDVILADQLPETEDWIAVRDRLQRASAAIETETDAGRP